MAKKNKSFQAQLYIFFIVSIAIPILVIAMGVSWYYNLRMKQENQRGISNTMHTLSTRIESEFSDLERIAFTPYLYRDILQTLVYYRNGFREAPPSYIPFSALENNYVMTFSKLLFTAQQSIKSISFYPIYNDQKSSKWSYSLHRNQAGLQAELNADYFQSQWYKSVEKSNLYWLQAETGSPTVYNFFQVIRDPDSRKNIGILQLVVSTEDIFGAIDNIKLAPNTSILLVDKQDNIVYQSGVPFSCSLAQLQQSTSHVLYETMLANSSWRLIHVSNKKDLRLAQTFTFLFAFVICIFAGAMALLIYRKESKVTVLAIKDIRKTLSRIEKGDFTAQTIVEPNSELKSISNSVNQMGQKLQNLIQREYQAVIQRQIAEYQALQAQINPHFLYNILNDFVALNRMEEREVLEKSIIRLTQIFRFTCNPSNTVTVKEEISFCKQFLQLHQIQLEERLQFHIDMQEATHNIQIPKLVLQPLVENSIQHGMGNTMNHVSIQIQAYLTPEGDKLCLSVRDNGVGFIPEQISQEEDHFGMKNVRERLEYFKEGAELHIKSVLNKGTYSLIVIPIRREP